MREPHVRWCGSWGRATSPGYPIRRAATKKRRDARCAVSALACEPNYFLAAAFFTAFFAAGFLAAAFFTTFLATFFTAFLGAAFLVAVLVAAFAFVAIWWVSFLWLFGVRLRVKNFARALWMRKVRIFARRIFALEILQVHARASEVPRAGRGVRAR